jgi:hypothetical protein
MHTALKPDAMLAVAKPTGVPTRSWDGVTRCRQEDIPARQDCTFSG